MRLPHSIALAVPSLALIRCVGGARWCPAWHTRPPAFPFERVMRELHQQQQQTSCLCFRFLSPCVPMSSDTFWSDACRNAEKRPLPTVLDAVYASCGVTVRRPPLLPFGACPAHVCVAGCLICA